MIIDTPDWDSTSLGLSNMTNSTATIATTIYEPSEDTFLVLDALELDLEHTISNRLLYHNDATILPTKTEPLLVVELGCGAGLLTAAVAKALNNGVSTSVQAHCMAVDVNSAACHATAHTCKLNQVQADIVCGDLLTWMRRPEHTSTNNHIAGYGLIDLLLFNPPYVRGPDGELAPIPIASKIYPNDKMMQDQLISLMTDAAWLGGGPDGVDIIKRALHQAADLLSERGVFYVVMIDYNYAALVREEMCARNKQTVDDSQKNYQENSADCILLTTFGSSPMSKSLMCRRILSRIVPGEQLAVYRVYRPHVLESDTKEIMADSLLS